MRKRDNAIDILRGLAIFTMVASNLTPYALADETPEWFRFYGTFAAPLFVFLAGMMVSLGSKNHHSIGYYFIRGAALIGVGAWLDTYVWGLYPFLSMDVLYLIGVSMPLCYLVGKLPVGLRVALTGAVFALMPQLQAWSPYRHSPDNITLASGMSAANVLAQVDPIQSWLIDGWFPLFPWLGVAFAGVLAGELRLRSRAFDGAKTFVLGAATLAAGIVWWLDAPVVRFARGGYPDLFYPPTLAFFCVAAGVVLLLFYLVDTTVDSPLYAPFKLYGRCSLLMYILHTVVIGEYFWPEGGEVGQFAFGPFFQVYLLLMLALLVVAWLVSKLKPKHLPAPIRFFLGS